MKLTRRTVPFLALLLLASACSKGLSAQDYFAQLATISSSVETKGTELSNKLQTDMGAVTSPDDQLPIVKAFVGASLALTQDTVTKVEALKPPADLQAAHDAFLANMKSMLAAFQEAQKAVDSSTSMDALNTAMEEVGTQITDAATKLDESCATLQDLADTQEIDVDLKCTDSGSGDEVDADRAAQAGLRNGLVAAKVLFTDTDDYSGITTESMASVEPSLTYVDGTTASSGSTDISVYTDGDTTVALAALSESGTCFLIMDVSTTGTTFGSTTDACTGDAAKAATDTAW